MLKCFHCRYCGADISLNRRVVVVCEEHLAEWLRDYGRCVEGDCSGRVAAGSTVCAAHKDELLERAYKPRV